MGSLIEHYELVRAPIPADRWQYAYGWSREEAARMDGTSSEVRLYHVGPTGTREINEGKASIFEFGYGGTGPHDSARAIVMDLTGARDPWTPARLRELVPEVFGREAGHDDTRCLIMAEDVRRRL